MSQENVEILKAWYDAYNREDWDAMVKDAAPGLEVDFSRSVGPLAGVFGLDQAMRLLKEFREAWESARMEPHEFIEAGDLVVVPQTQHLKGRGGIEVVVRGTFVWTIRNGAIERMVMYQEKEDALEAVGPPFGPLLDRQPPARGEQNVRRSGTSATDRRGRGDWI